MSITEPILKLKKREKNIRRALAIVQLINFHPIARLIERSHS